MLILSIIWKNFQKVLQVFYGLYHLKSHLCLAKCLVSNLRYLFLGRYFRCHMDVGKEGLNLGNIEKWIFFQFRYHQKIFPFVQFACQQKRLVLQLLGSQFM